MVITEITNKDINDIDIMNNDLYMYENIGIDNNSGTYLGKINSVDNNIEINLNYPVFDFKCYDDKIYISNARLNETDKTKIYIYSQEKLLEEIEVESTGVFYEIGNSIYFATTTYFMNLSNKKIIKFINEDGKNIVFDTPYDILLNTDDSLYLVNHTVNKDVIYYVSDFNESVLLKEVDDLGDVSKTIEYNNRIHTIDHNNRLFSFELHKDIIYDKQLIDLEQSKETNYIGFEIR